MSDLEDLWILACQIAEQSKIYSLETSSPLPLCRLVVSSLDEAMRESNRLQKPVDIIGYYKFPITLWPIGQTPMED
jgi:hypothetical protein